MWQGSLNLAAAPVLSAEPLWPGVPASVVTIRDRFSAIPCYGAAHLRWAATSATSVASSSVTATSVASAVAVSATDT